MKTRLHDDTVLARHNLTADEYGLIVKLVGREPNLTELGLFSAMWSEHCSYKSSKVFLKTRAMSSEIEGGKSVDTDFPWTPSWRMRRGAFSPA